MLSTPEKPAQLKKYTENNRDWSRVPAWGWTGLVLGNLTYVGSGVDITLPVDVFLSTLLVSFGYAFAGIILGTLVTLISKKSTSAISLFWTATRRRSFYIVAAIIAVMIVRSLMYYNGIISNALWAIGTAILLYMVALGRNRWGIPAGE